MRKLLAPPLALVVLLLVPQPAHAGTLSWDDPADDAVTLVLPSEPTLDILKTTLSSDGSSLVWETNLKEVAEGAPPESAGYHFQVTFDIGEATFNIRLTEDPQTEAVRLRTADTTTGQISTQVTCDKCQGEINRADKRLVVNVPIAELAALSKTAHPDAPPVAAGTELAGITVGAYRSLLAVYLTADLSDAPEDGSFVL